MLPSFRVRLVTSILMFLAFILSAICKGLIPFGDVKVNKDFVFPNKIIKK